MIKKELNFKIISLLIAFVFSFEAVSYATSDAGYNKTSLRMPIGNGKIYGDMRIVARETKAYLGFIVNKRREQIFVPGGGIYDVYFWSERRGFTEATICVDIVKDAPEPFKYRYAIKTSDTDKSEEEFIEAISKHLSQVISGRIRAEMELDEMPEQVTKWPFISNGFYRALKQTRLTILQYMKTEKMLEPVLEGKGTEELRILIGELIARSSRSGYVREYIVTAGELPDRHTAEQDSVAAKTQGTMFHAAIQEDAHVVEDIKAQLSQGYRAGYVRQIEDDSHQLGDVWLIQGKVFVISEIDADGEISVACSPYQVDTKDWKMATETNGNKLLKSHGEHTVRFRLAEVIMLKTPDVSRQPGCSI